MAARTHKPIVVAVVEEPKAAPVDDKRLDALLQKLDESTLRIIALEATIKAAPTPVAAQDE